MIVAVRVDERLLHGQVLIKWVDHCRCRRVVVVDGKTHGDPFLKSVMRAALPRDIQLDFYPLEGGGAWAAGEDGRRTLVLFRDVETLAAAVRAGAKLEDVNLARPPRSSDLPLLEELAARGLRVTVQMVPDSPAVPLAEGGRTP